MAVGGTDPYHRKAEILTVSKSWITIREYPYSGSDSVSKLFIFDSSIDSVQGNHISRFASVFINGNFFIIGGVADRDLSNTIARLDATWSWSRAGRLNTARRGHGAIWVNSKLVVVGGDGTYKTEFCDLKNNEFTCMETDSTLEGYDYPLLFAVTDDYGNC